MGCLAQLVGSDRACGALDGIVYVGDFGISEKEIGDYLSADSTSVPDFLGQRIRQAERVVSNDVLRRYASRIIPTTFVDRARLGDFDDSQTILTAPASTVGGIVMEVCLPSANVKVEVSRLEIWSDVGGTVSVNFYDLEDGTLLHTEPVVTTADTITAKEVSIAFSVRRKKTRILVSTSLPTYYKSTIGKGGCSTCQGTDFAQGPLRAYGAYIDSSVRKKYSAIERASFTSGLGLIASLSCDHGAWLCEVKEFLALPMGYKVCEEIVSYGVNNFDRFNNRVGMNQEALKERASYFAFKYTETMDNMMKHMPLPSDHVCFDCRHPVANIISIP